MMKLAEILESLKAPIPQRLISKKEIFKQKVKVGEVDYVSWINLSDILDDLCGLDGWEWQVKDVQQIGENLTLTGVLTLHGEDKSLTRMATGIEDINCSSYGDPSSNAEAMALRRCCAKFGLGRDLWRKDNKDNQGNRSPQQPQIQPKPQHKGTISRDEWLRRKANKTTEKLSQQL
jgi:hypothetical protein